MQVFIGQRCKSSVISLWGFTVWFATGTASELLAQPPERPPDRQPIYATDDAEREPADDPLSEPPAAMPVREAEPILRAVPEDDLPETPSGEADSLGASNYDVPPVTAVSASFNGVQPGKSNLDDVKRAWGEPANLFTLHGTERYVYAVKSFRRIEVEIDKNLVRSIMIHFERPFEPDALAAKLKMNDLRPVEVQDERGERLGRVYPERGVLLSYSPTAARPEVTHILLEPIAPEAFILRAQTNLHGPCGANLADLDYALSLDAESAEAHHLRAEVLLVAGHPELARRACLEALRHDPARTLCRLTLAEALFELGRYDQALAEIQTVAAAKNLPELAKAQLLLLQGELLARGPALDFSESLKLHMEAIRLASPLATSTNVDTRRGAKRVLVQAHLGVARSIGWGNWKKKPQVVRKWLERAETLANDLIENEQAGLRLRLLVAEYVLYAHAGFKNSTPPEIVAENARELADTLIASADDPLWQASIRWQLGRAYDYAAQIEHFRGSGASGLKYGELAVEELKAALAAREFAQISRTQLGQLYATIGAICAIHHLRHAEAVSYYEQALPLLSSVDAPSSSSGRLGEILVSMGVSYWETDKHGRALELTEQGAQLISAAVREGTLPRSSLAVPYNNLSSMHQQLGDEARAASFAELATKSQQTARK